jgi:UrcA family protein
MNPFKSFRLVASAISLLIVTAVGALMARLTSHASGYPAARLAITVDFHDLNLSTPDGIAAFKGRVRVAARRVCAVGDPRNLRNAMAAKRCMDEATSRALAYVGVPRQ